MNEARIWKFLIERIGNPAGVAGLMGNLYAESALNPRNLQQSFEKKLGMTDDSYTESVDHGAYKNFVHDSAGYGIAQWTYWSRKEKLLSFAKSRGASIGDLDMQLEFLWIELQGYTGVLKSICEAKSVRKASDVVLTQFERPTDQSEKVKEKRAGFAQKYYDQFVESEQIDRTDGGDNMSTNYRKYILSTGTHYIANSGSDESGKYHGGQAGDQTGKEFCLRSWYKRPWTCVLRFPDIRVATLIAQLGIDAALNDKIGYDQYQRDSFWKQLKKVGYLPSKITVACEEDCTAGVNAIVHAAAYLLGIDALKAIPESGVRSTNMRKHFSAAGFQVLTESKYLTKTDYLLPGDILLYDNHHGATNVTAGKKVTYTYTDVIGPFIKGAAPVDGLNKGDTGSAVEAMQKLLLKWRPDCLPECGADGDFGAETEKAVKAFQKEAGLKASGIYDAATEKALKEKVYGKVEITGGSLNVRSAPGYDTKVLGTVHKGDVLVYQGEVRQAEGKDWYLVIFNGQNAWVSSKYARLVE